MIDLTDGGSMTLQKARVTEHIDLSCIRTDRFKTGVLTLTLTLPRTKQNAAANSVLAGVMRRGTERYPDMAAINRRLDDLYAACIEIRSNKFSLVFTAEMLDESYVSDGTPVIDGVIEMMAELLLHPRMQNGGFDGTHVKQEIRFAADSVRSEINNTRIYATIRLRELMHRQDPEYPTLKSLEQDISALTTEALTDYYQYLLSHAKMDVFYVGSLSLETIKEKLFRFFGSAWVPSEACLPHFPKAEAPLPYHSLTEPMPVSQGKLAMGFRVGVCMKHDGDAVYGAILLNELFGGSPSSKLFLNVRERMSLCYYCASSYNLHTGNLTVSAGIEPKNRKIAEEAILNQMEAIRKGQISETELHTAKTSLENSYRQIYDNPFELQAFYGIRSLLGGSDDIETSRKKLCAVTADEVIALANQTVCDTVFFVEGTKTEDAEDMDDGM